MQIKTIDGTIREISHEEAMRIAEHFGHKEERHHFKLAGQDLHLTVDEMKMVSNAWWEKYGKSKMEEFFEHYRDKAAGNIQKALGFRHEPQNEKEVKAAIAHALFCRDPELAAEVIFEAAEWESAYFGLESIGE